MLATERESNATVRPVGVVRVVRNIRGRGTENHEKTCLMSLRRGYICALGFSRAG
jgi:hypothetical protein